MQGKDKTSLINPLYGTRWGYVYLECTFENRPNVNSFKYYVKVDRLASIPKFRVELGREIPIPENYPLYDANSGPSLDRHWTIPCYSNNPAITSKGTLSVLYPPFGISSAHALGRSHDPKAPSGYMPWYASKHGSKPDQF
ncbi:uncharacterized protein RAG0_11553 [Rhynchosporium agropyri]|uniref:Uncharacterized protein n=1 Tax=Rhynchosporium agropyri TaxID=914238 RepID=A0A1E1L4K2_9HELO|nr:uncharacterized protein RAG0_11553 [Rhynchosporium agropyri]